MLHSFLSDFYIFRLTDNKINDSYEIILKHICGRSAFIDVLFLHVRPSLVKAPVVAMGHPVLYIAIRDDHNTFFLLRRNLRTRGYSVATFNKTSARREVEIKTFPRVDSFREGLHAATPYVHDMTRTVPVKLFELIESDAATRDDILPFFPSADYFRGQYEAHTIMKFKWRIRVLHGSTQDIVV